MNKKLSWSEQYLRPEWQQKRLYMLEKADWKCECCEENKGLQLHVHHKYYKKQTLLWDYPDEAFEVLCEECHKSTTIIQRNFEETCRYLSSGDKAVVAGYAKGLMLKDQIDCPDSFYINDSEEITGLSECWDIDYHILESILNLQDYIISCADYKRLISVIEGLFDEGFFARERSFMSAQYRIKDSIVDTYCNYVTDGKDN